MTPTNAELRQFIFDAFSDEELDTLCFDYFREVHQNFTAGLIKNRKVLLLIGYCDTRDLMGDLYAALERERPAKWRQRFGVPPVEKPGFSEETRFLERGRDPRQIFLSHATADAIFARRLADDLRAEGWRVWIAPDSIRPGEKWVEAIERGLEESGVFVVALTPAALASKWVKTETNAAIDLVHADEIRFVSLDVAEVRLTALWRQFQYITFRRSYEVGLVELLRWLDGESVETARRSVSTPEAPTDILAPRPPSPPAPFPGYRALSPDRIVHEKTEIEFVRVPAGAFIYGEEETQRPMELPEFWIGRAPVTNAQFYRFVKATGFQTRAEQKGSGWVWTGKEWGKIKGADWQHPTGPESSRDGKDHHPVVQLSWNDAKAFCDWVGLTLPTEEQWEKAARGTVGRIWPWGNEEPTAGHCNFGNQGGTTRVGKYSPRGDSPNGCVDMAGNIHEWTASWFDPSNEWYVLRGGSWASDAYSCRCARRDTSSPNVRYAGGGFRALAIYPVGSNL